MRATRFRVWPQAGLLLVLVLVLLLLLRAVVELRKREQTIVSLFSSRLLISITLLSRAGTYRRDAKLSLVGLQNGLAVLGRRVTACISGRRRVCHLGAAVVANNMSAPSLDLGSNDFFVFSVHSFG